ncbi:PREDICTED: uncharacterized protein LOC105363928, partial [Ceratosolen solmsi marchali]|uniref:Uncharacterized protein LOC105363928 n=1 Tax=Ceratosolen solmsi marchali TaxID=326594 RepID=A0AAJ7DXI3_9HYME
MHDNKPTPISKVENKKWEVKCNDGGKIYECARCGYISERKSNVGRHFRRFHSELDKYKTCICKKRFVTKGEYYEHCNKVHRHLRHSWYINTLKYKIRKIKVKTKKIGVIESNYQAIQCNAKRGLRSSPRLQSLYKKGLLNAEKSIIDDISSGCNIQKSIREIKNDIKENTVLSVNCDSDIIREKINLNTGSKSSLHLPEFHMIIPLTNLPLKKRFGAFPKRKCLSDIKNFNNNNASEKTHIGYVKNLYETSNNNEVKIHNLNLAKIDEQQRAFISQIDFDELNAILNLKY